MNRDTIKWLEKEELKACPFCGGLAHIEYRSRVQSGDRYSRVSCTGCGIGTKKYFIKDLSNNEAVGKAIDAWNMRIEKEEENVKSWKITFRKEKYMEWWNQKRFQEGREPLTEENLEPNSYVNELDGKSAYRMTDEVPDKLWFGNHIIWTAWCDVEENTFQRVKY